MASREVAETEVESVAFAVCDAIVLDTGDYSFPYVARWSSGDVGKVKGIGERVVQCAGEILRALAVEETTAKAAS